MHLQPDIGDNDLYKEYIIILLVVHATSMYIGGGGRYVDIYSRHMQPNMSAVAHLSNPSNSNRYFCMNKLHNHAHPNQGDFSTCTQIIYIHTDSNNTKSSYIAELFTGCSN